MKSEDFWNYAIAALVIFGTINLILVWGSAVAGVPDLNECPVPVPPQPGCVPNTFVIFFGFVVIPFAVAAIIHNRDGNW